MGFIPLPSNKTVCVDGSGICASKEILEKIKQKIKTPISGGHDDERFQAIDVLTIDNPKGVNIKHEEVKPEPDEVVQVLDELKEHYNCDTEECVINKACKDGFITKKEAEEVKLNIKPIGPIDNSWFDNVNIYNLLKRWMHQYKDFYAFDYAMIDFRNYPEEYELARVKPSELYKKGYRTFGCVCNTDKHARRGKHWVSIFGDMRGDVWSVEFFNSTGNKYQSFLEYTEEAAKDLRDNFDNEVIACMASSKMHQRSNSECGPYSVYYIWARLKGIPYTWFEKEYIPDNVMYKFRETIFANGAAE